MIPELDALCTSMENCQACTLGPTRSRIVFGAGNPLSKVMFVGEGPGENEDRQGEPFVGRAGILLDKLLLASDFSRTENVYITNVVKCRPPGNRDPQAEEIGACIGYLRDQVRIIKPRIIVCLGRVAGQAIIGPNFRVTRDHGNFALKKGIWYMGTYHPSALLRNPANKPEAYADLLALRDKFDSL